eukprot:m.1231452 g.1231452  ORF g.1231452 m.1231452 type:complete len:212 (-) comp24659_c0_seq9:730-1365(-)
MAPVTEKVSKSRHIQFVSGVRGTEYWFGSYCFDAATSVTTSVFMTIVLALSGIDGLRGEQAGYVLVVLLFFIWAALPLVYSMTYMYKSSAGAYALTTMVFFLLTLVMVIVVFILPLLADGKYRKNGIAQDVKLGFFVNPLFACVQSIIDIYQNYQFLSVCSSRMVCRVLRVCLREEKWHPSLHAIESVECLCRVITLPRGGCSVAYACDTD